MKQPRLVATDLDGTLLRSDGTVSERTRAVLRELDTGGVPVVMATGRPLRWMEQLWDEVGRHGLAIVANGAVVYDVTAGRVRDVRGIVRGPGLDLARAIEDLVPGVVFAIETVDGIRVGEGFRETDRLPEGTPCGPLDEVWDQDAVKLLVRHDTWDFQELLEQVGTAVGEDATWSWSMEGLVEISAAGVTKAAALASVAGELGVDSGEVVAFGDMPNDLPMLTWAGRSYAVANAHPDVLEAAGGTAPANDEDGVAVTLERLFGLGEAR